MNSDQSFMAHSKLVSHWSAWSVLSQLEKKAMACIQPALHDTASVAGSRSYDTLSKS